MNYKLQHAIECWIMAWVDLACALISILTFTLWMPSWYFDVMAYFVQKKIEKSIGVHKQDSRRREMK